MGRELPIRLTTPMCDRVALHQGTFGHERSVVLLAAVPKTGHSEFANRLAKGVNQAERHLTIVFSPV